MLLEGETTLRALRNKSLYLGIFISFIVIHQIDSGTLSTKIKCYEGLGCLDLGPPWFSAWRPLPAPQNSTTICTEIYCFTRESLERYNVSLWPEIALSGCPFTSSRPTVFITHGFKARGDINWINEMKTNYLAKVDVNFFVVNWGPGALKNYFQAASNTRIVGAEILRFLKFLAENHGLQAGQLHFIGHSLGAHAVAYACKSFPGVSRLTGLDPAQPCFEGAPAEVRLDKGDAGFVEVVHTSAVPILPFLGFGFIKPVGDVDYYINGGFSQPGCIKPRMTKIKNLQDLKKLTNEVFQRWTFCSHSRSHKYYISAIKGECSIWAHSTPYSISKQLVSFYVPKLVHKTVDYSCTSLTCIPLGLDAIKYPGRGVFAAMTTKKPPYCDFWRPF